jgi:hypothetical protein
MPWVPPAHHLFPKLAAEEAEEAADADEEAETTEEMETALWRHQNSSVTPMV